MPLLSAASTRRDPFWGLDGTSARRTRLRRKVSRLAMVAIAVVALGLLATRLPTVDPQFLINGEGRPILAGAIFALLGSTILLGLSKLRNPAHR
jgi:hypothetical protein